MQPLGKYLIIAGILLIIAGILVTISGSRFSWFGNLPGDIRVEKEHFKFYMPITSMILVSIALSLILWLIRKLF